MILKTTISILFALFLMEANAQSAEELLTPREMDLSLVTLNGSYSFNIDGFDRIVNLDSENGTYEEMDLSQNIIGSGTVAFFGNEYYILTPTSTVASALLQEATRVKVMENYGEEIKIEFRNPNQKVGRLINIQKI